MPEDAELWMVMFPSRHATDMLVVSRVLPVHLNVISESHADSCGATRVGDGRDSHRRASAGVVRVRIPVHTRDPSTTKAGAVGRVFSRQADESCRSGMIDFTRN